MVFHSERETLLSPEKTKDFSTFGGMLIDSGDLLDGGSDRSSNSGSSSGGSSSGGSSSDGEEGEKTKSTPISFWQKIQDRTKDNCAAGGSDIASPRRKWLSLGFGQLIAFLAACMNASSCTLTQRYGVDTQFFQMFLMYNLLSINILWRQDSQAFQGKDGGGPKFGMDRQHRFPFTSINLRIPWWIYLQMSILDVLPNFMALFSFKYTSLPSTTLLGSLTAPATMLFSKFLLSKTFGRNHFFGVVLCLLGGSLTIWGDIDKDSETSSHYFIGDILAITAALMYGFGDTACEFFVKYVDRFEYMGMLGIFGTILTGLTFPLLEMQSLVDITRRPFHEIAEVCGVMAWYVLSVLLYYVAQAKFLVSSDATLLNLSLQAMNIWTIVFSVIAFHSPPTLSFYVAVMLVVTGVFVYELSCSSPRQRREVYEKPEDCFLLIPPIPNNFGIV